MLPFVARQGSYLPTRRAEVNWQFCLAQVVTSERILQELTGLATTMNKSGTLTKVLLRPIDSDVAIYFNPRYVSVQRLLL